MTEMRWTREQLDAQDPEELSRVRWLLTAKRLMQMGGVLKSFSNLDQASQTRVDAALAAFDPSEHS